jgi:PAS domain S-box-containing protein
MDSSDDTHARRLTSRSEAGVESGPDLLRAAFDASPIAMAITTTEGAFLEINASALRLFGRDRGEVIGGTSTELELLAPERPTLARDVVVPCPPGDLLRTLRAKSGALHDVAIHVTRLENKGEPALLTTFCDVTEQRRALEQIAARGARDRSIVELAREGIAMIDGERRWTFANRRLEEMLGYEPGGMIGRPFVEVVPDDDAAANEARLAKRHRGITEDGETRLIRRDGKEIWVKFEAAPMLDETRRYVGSICVLFEITERRNAEEALRASEEQLREAQRIAHVGSWEWDLRTNLVTRSEELCRIVGEPEESTSAVGGPSRARLHPDDAERVTAEVQQALATQQRHELNFRIVRSSGVVHLNVQAVIVRDSAGNAVRAHGTAQDVTEKLSVEARLRLADRMVSVGTLAAGVAHEINNPLAYILANLELAIDDIHDIAGGPPSGRLRDLVALIADAREGGERVRRIVRGLKAFSRADEESRVVVDVNQAINVAVAMANNEIRHRARLVKDVGEELFVVADESRLAQVVLNLLVNAAQAIPEGHAEANEIRVVARKDDVGRVVIEVRDTGPGMSPEVLARVFDPFFTTKPIGVGTGLGLAICHGIIAALGGEVTAQSERGKGAAFFVALPAAQAAAPADEAKPQRADAAPRRGRILIVDDDAMVGKTLSRVLKDHDVTTLQSAQEAHRRILGGQRFDVIFCDLMMPEMTGMEFHAELACSTPLMAERMIFVTGGAFTPTATAFLAQVPNEQIDKPFDPRELRAIVQRILG